LVDQRTVKMERKEEEKVRATVEARIGASNGVRERRLKPAARRGSARVDIRSSQGAEPPPRPPINQGGAARVASGAAAGAADESR
jgi:hypothetical protein